MPNPTATDGTVKNAYFAVFFEFSMKLKAGDGFEPDPFATIIPFTDAVHGRLEKTTPGLPCNRIDDFPGANRFELCVNDGETEEVDVFGDEHRFEYGFYWYGERDWVTPARAQALQTLVQTAIAQAVEDNKVPDGVCSIRMGKTEVRKEIAVRRHEVFQSNGDVLFERKFSVGPKP